MDVIDFWTESDARISSSMMAVLGSITSGESEPKDPYLAALDGWGLVVVRRMDAAIVDADVFRKSRREDSDLVMLSSVDRENAGEEGANAEADAIDAKIVTVESFMMYYVLQLWMAQEVVVQ